MTPPQYPSADSSTLDSSPPESPAVTGNIEWEYSRSWPADEMAGYSTEYEEPDFSVHRTGNPFPIAVAGSSPNVFGLPSMAILDAYQMSGWIGTRRIGPHNPDPEDDLDVRHTSRDFYVLTLRRLLSSSGEHLLPAIHSVSAEVGSGSGVFAQFEDILVTEHLRRAVDAARDELFLDGMDSSLSVAIDSAVRVYADSALRAVDSLLSSGKPNVETSEEILRVLGSIEDARTHQGRLTILVAYLQSVDPRIRDAAMLGLASLDDPTAIGPLRRAVSNETSSQLKRNLEAVLEQLLASQ